MRRYPSSWSSTLAKLGLKWKRRRPHLRATHQGRNGRRASLESLESRHLLTAGPWAGTDLIVGDFDGDGNIDRLGNMAVSSTNPEFWSIDTKASSAAGTTENWRVVRPALSD